MKFSEAFNHFAKATAHQAGQPRAFVIAVSLIVIWAATGPVFGYNDSWQLIINTGTTIITFLMVFLIQSTQNRDTVAMQLKLDELIRAMTGARDQLIDIEDLTEEELEQLRARFARLAGRGQGEGEAGEGRRKGTKE
jgi:low affinity Fe/Cu permease